ncbi:MAG: TlpA disulfide reductase family protein [Pelobacteraceae bacterium]
MSKRFGPSKICRAILYGTIVMLAPFVFFAGCEKNQGVKTGETPPEIYGTDIHGDPVSLRKLKGNVVVLYFWSNSCCGDKLKLLQPYYIRNKDKGVAILAINGTDSREAIESYAKKNGVSFTLQSDEHSMTSREYGVFGFPTLFIIDREGIVRKRIMGYIEPDQLNKYVVQYVISPGP